MALHKIFRQHIHKLRKRTVDGNLFCFLARRINSQLSALNGNMRDFIGTDNIFLLLGFDAYKTLDRKSVV